MIFYWLDYMLESEIDIEMQTTYIRIKLKYFGILMRKQILFIFQDGNISLGEDDLRDDDENKENSYLSDGGDDFDMTAEYGGGNDDIYRERYRDTKTRYYLKGKRNGKIKGKDF